MKEGHLTTLAAHPHPREQDSRITHQSRINTPKEKERDRPTCILRIKRKRKMGHREVTTTTTTP